MEKLKNPYFWLSLIALIFSAAGVDFNELTSWNLLFQALWGILQNPVSIIAIVTAFLGIWNDNSTAGMDSFVIRRVHNHDCCLEEPVDNEEENVDETPEN